VAEDRGGGGDFRFKGSLRAGPPSPPPKKKKSCTKSYLSI